MFVFDSFPKLTFLAGNLNPLITDYGCCFFIPKAHLDDGDEPVQEGDISVDCDEPVQEGDVPCGKRHKRCTSNVWQYFTKKRVVVEDNGKTCSDVGLLRLAQMQSQGQM